MVRNTQKLQCSAVGVKLHRGKRRIFSKRKDEYVREIEKTFEDTEIQRRRHFYNMMKYFQLFNNGSVWQVMPDFLRKVSVDY